MCLDLARQRNGGKGLMIFRAASPETARRKTRMLVGDTGQECSVHSMKHLEMRINWMKFQKQ